MISEKETVELIKKEIKSYIEKKRLYTGIKLETNHDLQINEKTVNEIMDSPQPSESFGQEIEKLYKEESNEVLDYFYRKMRKTMITEETKNIWEKYDNQFRKNFTWRTFCHLPFEYYRNEYYNCSIIVDTGYSGKELRLLCKIPLGNLLGMADIWKSRRKNNYYKFYIKVNKNTKCRFCDKQYSFSSKFKFRLEEEIKIPMDKIIKVKVEKTGKYIPDKEKSLDDKAYTEAKVKFFYKYY